VLAKGTCIWCRPQFSKHAPRSHQAMQNSLPVSFVGGRRSRSSGLVPPGRTVMLVNAVSGAGFAARAAGVFPLESAVRVDTPVLDLMTELAPVGVMLGSRDAVDRVGVRGAMYSSGSGTQFPGKWKVPLRRLVINAWKSGKSTPSCPATTFVEILRS
jgi:hypothetical protein